MQAVLQAVLETIPAVVYVRDVAGVFRFVNQAHAKFLGLSPDQVVGQRDADLFPPEVVAGFHTNDQQAIAAGQALETEETATMPDGAVHAFRSIKGPIVGAAGDLLGTVGISLDITSEHERARLLQAFLDHSPMVMYVKDVQGRYILVNRQVEQALGLPHDAILGKTDTDLFPPEMVAAIQAHDAQVVAEDRVLVVDEVVQHDGVERIYQNTKFPLHNALGQVYAVGTFALDVTEQRRLHAELARRVAERTAALEHSKREALRELSTPLIPLTDDVLLLPLVGTIDTQRAQMVMEALLTGVAEHQADLVILDITGVAIVDTQVAQAFIQAAQAVRLLGARVMLTGIQPAMAQTLVHLGVDLSGLETRGSLQAGIAAALRRPG